MVAVLLANAAMASANGGFSGIEFLGSSQLSKNEITKLLGLRSGAKEEAAIKKAQKLKETLEAKGIKTNIEMVAGNDADFFITIDIIDTGISSTLPTRKLYFPRHIRLTNEKPFSLLQELHIRQEKLRDEGRPNSERYKDGVLFFTDEPCNRLVDREKIELAGQENEVYQVIKSDPNAERRLQAIELLNWTGDYTQNCSELIPAIADSDKNVRIAATKYIWARLSILPKDFPWKSLLEAFSQQLLRPSASDRSKSLAALLALSRCNPAIIDSLKSLNEARLKEIAENSIIPNTQNMARELLRICNTPQAERPVKREWKEIGPGF